MRWETDCGNPETPDRWHDGRKVVSRVQEHKTKKSAETRMLKHLDEVREIGRIYNHDLQDAAASVIEQVKGTALDHLPLNEWRGWSVTDSHNGTTIVVRVRRTA